MYSVVENYWYSVVEKMGKGDEKEIGFDIDLKHNKLFSVKYVYSGLLSIEKPL